MPISVWGMPWLVQRDILKGHLSSVTVTTSTSKPSVPTAAEGRGGPGTSQRGHEAKKGAAPEQAHAEGPATPPAKGDRAPNTVERVQSRSLGGVPDASS